MSEEEKFDEIIRQKFSESEKEFVFNEENWEKAERKIDSGRKFSKIARWIAIFAIGLFSGVAIMLPFVVNKKENPATEVAALADKQKPENEFAEINKERNKSSVGKENRILSGDGKRENQYEEKEIAGLDRDQKTITGVTHPEIKKETVRPTSNAPHVLTAKPTGGNIKISDIPGQEARLEKPINKISAEKDKEDMYSASSPGKKINKKKLHENASSGKEYEPVQTASNQTKEVDKNPAPQNDLITTSDGKGSSVAFANKKNQSETPLLQTQLEEQMLTPLSETKKDSLVNGTDTATDLKKQPKGQAVAKDSLASKIDSSAIAAQNKPVELPSRPGLASATIFSIDAGTSFTLGWHCHDTVEARGFNPLLGIGFTHFFNPVWSLYAGIQYGSLANLKASERTFCSKKFNFGYSSVDTTVSTKRLYYAVFPFQLQYNLNNKNSIGIGGSVSYLMNSKSKVVIKTVSNDSVQTSVTQITEMGYYAGAFSRWDASLSVSYRRKISQRLSVSAYACYGLFDIKSNSFFSRDQFERNTGFKIVFTYDLFQY